MDNKPSIDISSPSQDTTAKPSQKHVPIKIVTLATLAVIGVFIVFLRFFAGNFDTRSKAAKDQIKGFQDDKYTVHTTSKPSFYTDELLIKLNQTALSKIRPGNPQKTDIGIPSLDATLKKFGVISLERVAHQMNSGNEQEDIFLWYMVKLSGIREKALGKIIAKNGVLLFEEDPTGSNTNERKALSDRQIELMQILSTDTSVQAVELNYEVTLMTLPNDPYITSSGSWGQTHQDLWGLHKINAPVAWDSTTGSTDIITAVVDTGVDRNHKDIAANMWVNTKEIPGNNKDDDVNGYVDDYYGWDFVSNDNDPMDDHGHGTHTAGTVGAIGNNATGVTGVNWKAKIMALKFLNAQGSGDLNNAIKALQYAANMGARVTSNSWGSQGYYLALDDALKYAHDRNVVTVAAAGNNNMDAIGFTPASSQYAITVSASNSNDAKACFSNWGYKIDVAAPGGDSSNCNGINDYILSLKSSVSPMCTSSNTIGNDYCIVRGTSMAAPHVAGLATLILSKNPALTNEQVRQIIRSGADDTGITGADVNFGFGRINAGNSVLQSTTQPLTPFINSPRNNTLLTQPTIEITGKTGGTGFAKYVVEIAVESTPAQWSVIADSTIPVTNGTLGTIQASQYPDGNYIIRLTEFDQNGKSYSFSVFHITINNFDARLDMPPKIGANSTYPINGSASVKNILQFDSFLIEWAEGTSPTTWSASGITLTSSGKQSILNGKLAEWNMSGLKPSTTYTLRLTVKATSGFIKQVTTHIFIDPAISPGWPIVYSNTGTTSTGSLYNYCGTVYGFSPAFADIDNDGQKEIISIDPKGNLYVYRKDKSILNGFPVSTDNTTNKNLCTIQVNVDDVNNDGNKEIIVMGDKLYVIKNDGRFLFSPITSVSSQGRWSDRTPSIADIDSDGKKELIFAMYQTGSTGATSLYVHGYSNNGNQLTGFPKIFDTFNIFSAHTQHGNVHLADLDKDGKYEIGFTFANRIYLLDHTGKILPGWPFIVPNVDGKIPIFRGSLASADIDGDGTLEITAVNSGLCFIEGGCTGGGNGILYAWKKNGSVLAGFPVISGIKDHLFSQYGTPALADFNKDGKIDIAVNGGIIDYSGAKISSGMTTASQYAIADVNNDSTLDVLGTSFYTGAGSFITAANGSSTNPSPLEDIDGNGKLEFAATNAYGNWNYMAVYLWELSTTADTSTSWPMYAHDAKRSGWLFGSTQTPPIHSPTPLPTTQSTPAPSATPTPGTDVTPPIISITQPTDGANIQSQKNVKIIATAQDAGGVASIEIFIDSVLKKTCTTSSCNVSWSTAQTPSGAHIISATAKDKSGNQASTSITVTK